MNIDLSERTFLYDRDFAAFPSGKRLIRLIAGNGIFIIGRIIQGRDEFIRVGARLEFVNPNQLLPWSELYDYRPGVVLSGSKIPYELILTAKGFFRAVCDRYKDSEAMLQILYSSTSDEWMFRPLRQEVTPATVKSFLGNEKIPDGFLAVGVIHSHGLASAFHSQIDDKSELPLDGVYITLGRVAEPNLDMSVSVVIMGVRFLLSSSDLIEIPDAVSAFPKTWIRYVTKGQIPALFEETGDQKEFMYGQE